MNILLIVDNYIAIMLPTCEVLMLLCLEFFLVTLLCGSCFASEDTTQNSVCSQQLLDLLGRLLSSCLCCCFCCCCCCSSCRMIFASASPAWRISCWGCWRNLLECCQQQPSSWENVFNLFPLNSDVLRLSSEDIFLLLFELSWMASWPGRLSLFLCFDEPLSFFDAWRQQQQ